MWVLIGVFGGSLAFGYWMNFYRAKSDLRTTASIDKRLKPRRAFSPFEKYRQGSVREALVARNSEFELCYENFLRTSPQNEEGKVVVQWLIQPDGTLKEPSVKDSTLQDESLHGCMLAVLPTLHFGKPPGDETLRVAHTFKFKRKSPTEVVFR